MAKIGRPSEQADREHEQIDREIKAGNRYAQLFIRRSNLDSESDAAEFGAIRAEMAALLQESGYLRHVLEHAFDPISYLASCTSSNSYRDGDQYLDRRRRKPRLARDAGYCGSAAEAKHDFGILHFVAA